MAEASTNYREYETVTVLKPDIDDARIVEVAERLREIVSEQGGKSIKFSNWGKKKLTFEVDKIQKGIFIHHLYVAPPKAIKEYERSLKFLDDALLYQTIRLQDVKDLDAQQSEEDQLAMPVRDNSRRDRDRDARDNRDRGSRDDRSRGPAKVEAKPEVNTEAASKPADEQAAKAEPEATEAVSKETEE